MPGDRNGADGAGVVTSCFGLMPWRIINYIAAWEAILPRKKAMMTKLAAFGIIAGIFESVGAAPFEGFADAVSSGGMP